MSCVAMLRQTTVTSGRSKWSKTSSRTRCLYCAQCFHIDTEWRASLTPVRTVRYKKTTDTVILNCMWDLRDQSNENGFWVSLLRFLVLKVWCTETFLLQPFYSAHKESKNREALTQFLQKESLILNLKKYILPIVTYGIVHQRVCIK